MLNGCQESPHLPHTSTLRACFPLLSETDTVWPAKLSCEPAFVFLRVTCFDGHLRGVCPRGRAGHRVSPRCWGRPFSRGRGSVCSLAGLLRWEEAPRGGRKGLRHPARPSSNEDRKAAAIEIVRVNEIKHLSFIKHYFIQKQMCCTREDTKRGGAVAWDVSPGSSPALESLAL